MLTSLWRRFSGRLTSHSWGRVKILVVDDELPVCHFVDRVLSDAGYATEIASSGYAALARAGACGPYDLLLTDVYMPDINGSVLAAPVRQLNPDIKVLCLTGYSDVLFEERGTLWENEAFVDKPVPVRALREAVALLLSGHPGV